MTTPSSRNAGLRRIQRGSLVDAAHRRIRDSITTGRYRMGEQIVEARVAADLEISRGPVREALRRLAEEGLVVERPRHGVHVREIGAEDFVDIYNLRIAIESAAIRLVTRRSPRVEPLERAIARMRVAAERGEADTVVNLELSFHEKLCELSGNAYLATTFRSLSALIRMALAVDDATYSSLEEIASEHQPLIEAIRSGDADRAAAELERHITSGLLPLLRRLGATPEDLLVMPT